MEEQARGHVVLIQSHVDCGVETVIKTAIVCRGTFVGRIIVSTSTVLEYHLPRIAVKSCAMELAVRVAQRTNPVVCMAETVILTLNALVI